MAVQRQFEADESQQAHGFWVPRWPSCAEDLWLNVAAALEPCGHLTWSASPSSPLLLLTLDYWITGAVRSRLQCSYLFHDANLFHNYFSISCKWFASIDIYSAHFTLLLCQDLAEHRGILISSPSCLLLLCISVGNGGLTVFTSKLFQESRDDHTCPASQVMLSMVSSVTFGLLFSWRNAAW